MVEAIEDLNKNNPEYLTTQNQKIAEKELALKRSKEEIQQKQLSKIEDHSNRMKIKRVEKEIAAKEADRKRRASKQKIKEKKSKKGASSLYKEYTSEEISAMSASKRRNLQDRGIIPKGI